MFVILTIVDVIRIPPSLLGLLPSVKAIHSEIDQKYPNRVLFDHGLVIGRYGDCQRVSHGFCVAGDGGSHHECTFRLLVFRPFVEEVCLGRIAKSTSEGIHVSLGGFFEDIFIPAYWMLRPSTYVASTGLWVWTPQYDDNENDDNNENSEDDEESNRYEMEIGSEIRFKVKSIHFTQVTTTAKGMQSTTTTTSHQAASSFSYEDSSNTPTTMDNMPGPLPPVRRQSSSTVDDSTQNMLPPMYIVGSICEDGLGLTSWWTNAEEEEPDEEGGDVDEEDEEETEEDEEEAIVEV